MIAVSRSLALAALLVGACSPQSADGAAKPPAQAAAAAVHPISGLPVIDLTVANGKRAHAFRVEVAATPQQQARGLMFRTTMGADECMILPMNPPRDVAFWMKNTVMPLDIIYIGVDGRISNIAANTTPYSEAPIPSVGPVKAVLELNAGRAAQLGIVPGDRVEW